MWLTSGIATLLLLCPNSPCALLIFQKHINPLTTDQSTAIQSVVSRAQIHGHTWSLPWRVFQYLLDDLGHVLRALVLQSGQLEQLGNPPDADDVVLIKDLCQGPATEALEPGQQVHVCHTQHVIGVLWRQLAGQKGVTAQS